MDRRKYLGIAGTVGLSSLAGCGGKLKAATRSGPPHFEAVELTGPDEIAVGEEFTLEMSAKNTGGEKGSFSNTLTVGQDPLSVDTNVRIEDIGVTQTKSKELGPFTISYTGDFEYRITDYGASHSLTVSTRELDGSESLTLEDGSTISLSGLSFHPSLLYSTSDGDSILIPDDGQIFAQISLSVENHGNDDLYVNTSNFSVPNGDSVTEVGPYRISDSDIQLDSSPFGSPTVSVGNSRSGWILREVPRDAVTRGISLSWDRAFGGSSPEVRWQNGGADVPDFEVTSVSLPSEVEIGADADASITVRNAGSAPGTFHGYFERRNADRETWNELAEISLDIPAQSSKTWSTTIRESYIGPSEYRVWPKSVTRTIDFVPATRSFGSAYTTPEGAKIQTDITGMNFNGFQSSYTYEGSFENTTVEADDRSTFAFVEISVEITGDEAVEPPSRSAFTAHVDGSEIAPEESQTYGTMELAGPVSGAEYDTGYGSISADSSTSGWLIFEVPEDTSKADVTVRCSTSHLTVEWSE